MRKKEMKILITFRTMSAAIAMEKCCKEENKPGRLIPVPGEITAGCGLAWAAPIIKKEELMKFLFDRQLVYEAITELMF